MRKIKSLRGFALRLFVLLLICSPWLSNPAHIPAVAAPAETTITVYESPLNPEGLPYELNPGVDGSLWVSDNLGGEIRHYAADGSSMVIYSGLGAVSDAHPTTGGAVWFVDQDQARLGRLDPDLPTASVQYWELPGGGNDGFGTTLDSYGRIWVSDFSQPILYRFDPSNTRDNVCTYDTSALADFGSPYITSDGEYLWFSSIYDNKILRLDPDMDPVSSEFELTNWHYSDLTWDFEAEDLLSDGAGGVWFSDSSGSLVHLDLTQTPANFSRYALPSGAGIPYILTRQDSQIWYSGQQPGTLGMLLPGQVAPRLYTPTQASAGLTPNCEFIMPPDPQPVTVSMPTETIWTAVNYPTSNPATGWLALSLGSESFPWGIHMAGNRLWAVDNGRNVLLRADIVADISACKLQDEDGDLETTGDQQPLSGWGMALYADGALASAAETGADGCVSWAGLELGRDYSVQEEQRLGWLALSPDTGLCDLDVLALPGEHACEFINAQDLSAVFLPLVQRPAQPTE